jgi:excisionase family DNA binding protein
MAAEAPTATRSRRMTKHVDVTYDIAKRKVLTIHEVSEYLRVSRQTIYRMLRRGDIPAFRIGGDWRFNIEDLGHWVEKGSLARKSRPPHSR